MRLSKDSTNWNATSVMRRDFRHTYGDPEIPKHLKKRGKKRAKKPSCKHVWVEVSPEEYLRYRHGGRVPSWYSGDVAYWTAYTTYYVCADCLGTKSKYDKGKMRAHYRNRRR